MGLRFITGPTVVMADYFPACGDLVGIGTDLISTILAGLISTVVIVVSWIYYRPLVGGAILLVIVCVIYSGGPVLSKRRGILLRGMNGQAFEMLNTDEDEDDMGNGK